MDPRFNIDADNVYIHKIDHRNNSPRKSQWTIPQDEERRSFVLSLNSGWCQNSGGWGVHLVNDTLEYLGMSVDRGRQLFIAKFVDGDRNAHWHGYPADPSQNDQDIPDEPILLDWKRRNFISAAKMRKIARGQQCSP